MASWSVPDPTCTLSRQLHPTPAPSAPAKLPEGIRVGRTRSVADAPCTGVGSAGLDKRDGLPSWWSCALLTKRGQVQCARCVFGHRRSICPRSARRGNGRVLWRVLCEGGWMVVFMQRSSRGRLGSVDDRHRRKRKRTVAAFVPRCPSASCSRDEISHPKTMSVGTHGHVSHTHAPPRLSIPPCVVLHVPLLPSVPRSLHTCGSRPRRPP